MRNRRKQKTTTAAVQPDNPSRAAKPNHALRLAVALIVLVLAGLAAWWAGRPVPSTLPVASVAPDAALPAPEYVGRESCGGCHVDEVRRWHGSQHDQAMQTATAETVLGDFNGAEFVYNGIASRFLKGDDGRFTVRTDGPDGELHDYPVKYTFGVSPLQQYLVEFPGGRLQALSIAWDTRPQADGGQRWFHLYPDDKVTHDDVLHWTRPAQNWNSQCAFCHSTHLEKNYRPADDSFATRWSEIDVSCEACHGPASNHVAWAKQSPGWQAFEKTRGLTVNLRDRAGVQWRSDPDTGNVRRSRPRVHDTEIEVCAPCHSRRSAISDDYVPGDPLLDHFRPALLQSGLYFPDGQIRDEVYVYGSFVQSRMYHAGVTCSDCHDPHSLELRRPGNGVCLQCHAADRYDTAAHHFHPPESPGARCAECHMPTRTYMVVDARHDHSLRIPRPDLSVALGTPNACNNCHADKTPEWAAAQVKDWYGRVPEGYQRYAEALAAAGEGDPAAARLLPALIRDTDSPAIARATALAALAPYLNRDNLDLISLGLWDDNPLVRVATVGMLQSLPPRLRRQLATSALQDRVLAVRIEAARVLAGVDVGDPGSEQQGNLDAAIEAYVHAQQVNAERPEAQVNLGNLYAALGRSDMAEKAYRTAIERNPQFVPAYVNLADFYRGQASDAQGEKVLRQALEAVPDSAEVHYALGLLLVRQKQLQAAIGELEAAAGPGADDPTFPYTYAIALHSAGQGREAVAELEQAHERFPRNAAILTALINYLRELGDTASADAYSRKLTALQSSANGN